MNFESEYLAAGCTIFTGFSVARKASGRKNKTEEVDQG